MRILILVVLAAVCLHAVTGASHVLNKRQARSQTNNGLGRIVDTVWNWFGGRRTARPPPPPTTRPAPRENPPLQCGDVLKQQQDQFQTQMATVRSNYETKLQYVRGLLDRAMQEPFSNPDVGLTPFCEAVDIGSPLINGGGNEPAPVATECKLSPWSEWRGPLGFGYLERERTIIEEGCGCPSADELVETFNLTKYTSGNNSFEDPEKVGENFQNDFLSDSTRPRDIAIIVDTSGSIYNSDFRLMQDGLMTMIDLFCGGFGSSNQNNRLSLIQFASNVTIVHRFLNRQDPTSLKTMVNNLIHYKGNTCTGDALLAVYNEIFLPSAGARDETQTAREVLLLTDGQSNCGSPLLDAAQTLQTRAKVFALGVGIASNPDAKREVESVVSEKDPKHIFSLAKFEDFKTMVDYVRAKTTNACQPIVESKKK